VKQSRAVETGDILQMVDSNAHDILDQINRKLKTRAIWPFCAVELGSSASCLVLLHLVLVIAAALTATSAYFDKIRKSVVLMYDL